MIDSVAQLIEDVDDPVARPRLRRCLPYLFEAVANFDASAASGRLVIAAATPKGAVVLAAEDWPDVKRSKLKRGDVALALSAAIECKDNWEGDTILIGLTVMLGRAGLGAQAADAALIRQDGKQPLVVALVERQPKTVTMLVTTVALPTGADGATVH
jgi:hypothetical protein